VKEKRKFRSEVRLAESYMLLLAGAFALFATLIFHGNPLLAFMSLVTSGIFVGLGTLDLALGIRKVDMLRRLEILEKLRDDHRGILAIWVVCFVSLCVYSMLWFTMGWAAFNVINLMTTIYQYPAQAMNTINLVKLVLTWHPVFFFFGMLLWAFNMSQKTETVTEPMGYF
jgi:hypothetical protein